MTVAHFDLFQCSFSPQGQPTRVSKGWPISEEEISAAPPCYFCFVLLFCSCLRQIHKCHLCLLAFGTLCKVLSLSVITYLRRLQSRSQSAAVIINLCSFLFCRLCERDLKMHLAAGFPHTWTAFLFYLFIYFFIFRFSRVSVNAVSQEMREHKKFRE